MAMKKIISLALTVLMIVGCDVAWDTLHTVNGSKFIVKSKTKENQTYLYRLIKVDNKYYTCNYRDTTNFEVDDTLIIIVTSVKNVDRKN